MGCWLTKILKNVPRNLSSCDWPRPAQSGYIMPPSRSRTTINCSFFGRPPSTQPIPPTGCCTTAIDCHCSWPRHPVFCTDHDGSSPLLNIWSRRGIGTRQWRPRPSFCPQSKSLRYFSFFSLSPTSRHLDLLNLDDRRYGTAHAPDARAVQGRHPSTTRPRPRHNLHPRPRHRRPPPTHQCRPLGYPQRRPHPVRPAVPLGWQCVCHCPRGRQPVGRAGRDSLEVTDTAGTCRRPGQQQPTRTDDDGNLPETGNQLVRSSASTITERTVIFSVKTSGSPSYHKNCGIHRRCGISISVTHTAINNITIAIRITATNLCIPSTSRRTHTKIGPVARPPGTGIPSPGPAGRPCAQQRCPPW